MSPLIFRLAAIVLFAHLVSSAADADKSASSATDKSASPAADKSATPAAAETSLKVVTVDSPPYVSVKTEDGKTTLTGFVPDLLEFLFDNLNKTYTLSASDSYGVFKDNKWTGLIGDLVSKKADLAAAPLTKSEARAKAVEFTQPILKTKLQLLKSKKHDKLTTIRQLVSENETYTFAALNLGNTWQQIKAAGQKGDDKELAEVSANLGNITSIADSIEKVRNGELVLILEGQFANYWVSEHPCDLDTTDGETIGQSELEYAFAVQKTDGTALLTALNHELDKNETKAKIEELQAKYWPKKECDDDSNDAQRLAVGAGLAITWLATLLLHVL